MSERVSEIWEGGGRIASLRAVMNVTPRDAPVRLKFVIFGTHN